MDGAKKKFKPGRGSGDDGFTDLLNGIRVKKTDPHIKLNAEMDDLNSALGLLKTAAADQKLKDLVSELQISVMKISSVVAGYRSDSDAEIREVEGKTAEILKSAVLPGKFVVPGDSAEEAFAHAARTKARLCEIAAWEAGEKKTAVFLNRLSDYLFLIAVSSVRNGAGH